MDTNTNGVSVGCCLVVILVRCFLTMDLLGRAGMRPEFHNIVPEASCSREHSLGGLRARLWPQ